MEHLKAFWNSKSDDIWVGIIVGIILLIIPVFFKFGRKIYKRVWHRIKSLWRLIRPKLLEPAIPFVVEVGNIDIQANEQYQIKKFNLELFLHGLSFKPISLLEIKYDVSFSSYRFIEKTHQARNVIAYSISSTCRFEEDLTDTLFDRARTNFGGRDCNDYRLELAFTYEIGGVEKVFRTTKSGYAIWRGELPVKKVNYTEFDKKALLEDWVGEQDLDVLVHFDKVDKKLGLAPGDTKRLIGPILTAKGYLIETMGENVIKFKYHYGSGMGTGGLFI